MEVKVDRAGVTLYEGTVTSGQGIIVSYQNGLQQIVGLPGGVQTFPIDSFIHVYPGEI